MNPSSPEPSDHDESPGVPGFRTWRGVYLFVFVFFVLCVVLLALFSLAFAKAHLDTPDKLVGLAPPPVKVRQAPPPVVPQAGVLAGLLPAGGGWPTS